RHHPTDRVATFRRLEIHRKRLLAPVEPHEVGSGPVHRVVVAASEISAVHPFDLDHPGAQVGQVAGGQRCGDGLLDRDDGDPVQRPGHPAFLLAARTRPPPTISRWISLVASYSRISRTSL